MMKIVAVVQARSASERFPRKVLADLAGKTVIDRVLNAIRASTLVDDVVLATTETPADDDLVREAHRLGVRVFRGSERDVLGRFVSAIDGTGADAVVRITGDDPLLDPSVIDLVVGAFVKHGPDYASNILERTWPRGLDTEVLTVEALQRSAREGDRDEDREHVTIFVRTHQQAFRTLAVKALPQDTWPDLRLCLDTREDYLLLQAVFGGLSPGDRILRVGEVLDFLRTRPELVSLNSRVRQREVLGKEY